MRALAAVLAPALLFWGGAAPSRGAEPSLSTGELRFERFNRSYEQVAPEILPIEEGPVTVRLSSPRNSLTVRNHVLRLEPGAGNSFTADLRVEFSGKGWLVADVDMSGVSTRLQDEVRVPPQALEMQGRIRLRKVRGGYEVTPEQLPRSVSVRIESGVGRSLLDLCDGVSALPLADVDCTALGQSLSRAVVPLPAAGESFLLEDADLTPAERRQLDGYLSPEELRTSPPRPGMNPRATQAAPHEWGFRQGLLLEAGLPGAALVARAFMPGRVEDAGGVR